MPLSQPDIQQLLQAQGGGSPMSPGLGPSQMGSPAPSSLQSNDSGGRSGGGRIGDRLKQVWSQLPEGLKDVGQTAGETAGGAAAGGTVGSLVGGGLGHMIDKYKKDEEDDSWFGEEKEDNKLENQLSTAGGIFGAGAGGALALDNSLEKQSSTRNNRLKKASDSDAQLTGAVSGLTGAVPGSSLISGLTAASQAPEGNKLNEGMGAAAGSAIGGVGGATLGGMTGNLKASIFSTMLGSALGGGAGHSMAAEHRSPTDETVLSKLSSLGGERRHKTAKQSLRRRLNRIRSQTQEKTAGFGSALKGIGQGAFDVGKNVGGKAWDAGKGAAGKAWEGTKSVGESFKKVPDPITNDDAALGSADYWKSYTKDVAPAAGATVGAGAAGTAGYNAMGSEEPEQEYSYGDMYG